MSKSFRVAFTFAAAAALSLVSQAPAMAASAPQGFNVSTKTGGTYAGYANATGSVSFNSWRSFNVTGKVADLCPKDGAGAYAFVAIQDEYSNHAPIFINQDVSGCGDGATGSLTFTYTASYRVVAVRIVVQEGDNVNGTIKWSSSSYDNATGARKYNPYA